MKTIECKTGEIAKTYKEYLKTNHWKILKQQFFDSPYSYGRCYFCKITKVQLHHKSYARLGNENLEDLVEVCRKHHRGVHKHGLKFRRRKRQNKKVSRKMSKKQRTTAFRIRNDNMEYTEKIEDGISIKVYAVPEN